MSNPKQSCPKCGFEIGKLLYCTPLDSESYYCPGCKHKIQEKCSECGTWLTLIERYCQKCGTKNTFFYQLADKNKN
ncbi:MAG: zinc ribbon domain-containing protein [Candidatus Bathyarchaeota archaeon]|jgi:hypothetical protein|nr:zinc ribbon domain-containing protein [Candidatus Bathyarchaeota archaeon]